MKRGNEALNASSLQFFSSVKRFIASLLQFFLRVKRFIAVTFMENTSFNSSSPLLFKRNSLLNASLPLLFKVTQWRRPCPENVSTRDWPVIWLTRCTSLWLTRDSKVQLPTPPPPNHPGWPMAHVELSLAEVRTGGMNDHTLQSPTIRKPRNSNTRNYNCKTKIVVW